MPNGGYSDHIGFVEEVSGGNTDTGKKNVEAVAKEVLAGKWGNGEDRKKRLQAAE